MELTFDLISLLNLLAILQGFALAGILFASYLKRNEKSNLLLGALMAFSSFSILYGILLPTDLYRHLPHLILSGVPFQFLLGPFLWFYTTDKIQKKQSSLIIKSLHYLPAAAVLISYIPFYVQDSSTKIAFISSILENGKGSPKGQILWIIFLVQFVAYLSITILFLYRHERSLKKNFSAVHKRSLKWLRNLLLLAGSTLLLLVLLTVFYYVQLFLLNLVRIIPLPVSVFLYVIGYKILLSPGFRKDRESVISTEKYKDSKMDRPLALEIQKRLDEAMTEKKLYLEPDLSLADLSEELETNRSYLSEVFSTYLKTTFYQYVNGFRCEKLISLLKDPKYKNETLIALAFEAGFNSKAAFNSFFKKYTGQTPSAYRKGLGI